jgi:Domain of unknown function (DUF4276)
VICGKEISFKEDNPSKNTMKRIIIICEGPTEKEFCIDVLYPYFLSKGILIETPLIKKTGGGIVAWQEMKKQITNHLKQDNKAFVTTFIDYYGTKELHEFPKWAERLSIVDKNERMDFLEKAMSNDIEDEFRFRFLPYMQLHEFESLLFSDITEIKNQIGEKDILDSAELDNIVAQFPNPEFINDSKTTAPSKRLLKIINGYNKIVYGSLLAQSIGLVKIRERCPRFNEWLIKIEQL